MRANAWFLLFAAVGCTTNPSDGFPPSIVNPEVPDLREGGSSGTDGSLALTVSSMALNHISANRPAWLETRTFDTPKSSAQAWASVEVAADEVLAVAMRSPSGEIVDAQFVSETCEHQVVSAPATLSVPTEFATIQAAVDAARPYDTVRVLAGTYHERVQLRSGVRLIGAGARETIIDGDGLGQNLIDFSDARDVVVSGFTLRNVGRGEGCARPLDVLACSGNWYASAVYADGHAFEDKDPCNDPSIYFSDNIVRDNDVGMMLYFHPYAVVRNNVFVSNRVGFAANHHADATTLLAWNVFYQNEDEALAVSASFMDILSNVFVENGSALRQEYCQRGRLRCNVLFDNESLGNRAFLASDGNLFTDPLLSPEDYTLDPQSPVFDTECVSEMQTEASQLRQCELTPGWLQAPDAGTP
jgi:hypothetical protein